MRRTNLDTPEGSIALRFPRRLVTIAMNAILVVGVLLAIYVAVSYFGAISGTRVGSAYVRVCSLLVLPFGLPVVRSLYGGTFDPNAALTVIICLAAEWALSVWRARL